MAKAPAKTESGTEVALPSFMRGKAGFGSENIGMEHIETPRITLLQAVSKEVSDGYGKPGDWFHTIAEETIGTEILFVPIWVQLRYLLWNPLHAGGGILARADDGIHWTPPQAEFEVKLYKDLNKKGIWRTAPTVRASGLAEWGSYDPEQQDSQPAATKMMCVVGVFPELRKSYSPAVITFQRSSVKVGERFVGKLKMAEAPSYGCLYRLTSVQAENSSGQEFLAPKVTAEGFVQDEEAFNAYEALYEKFAKEGLKIKDEEGLQSELADPDSGNGGGEDSHEY